jgi:hypothetical protein
VRDPALLEQGAEVSFFVRGQGDHMQAGHERAPCEPWQTTTDGLPHS